MIDHGRTAGRVPHGDIKAKVEQVITDDTVISINDKVATVPFRGRPFTMCLHSDLPGSCIAQSAQTWLTMAAAVEAMASVKAAVEEAKLGH